MPFGGEASFFATNDEKVISRNQISTIGPSRRAAHLLLHCGKDLIANQDGAQQILRILRERFAPDAIDAIIQEVAKFMNFKRADQTMDVYLLEFDVLREKAQAQMATGGGFPGEFASAHCMQNAALPENGKCLA